MMGIICYYLTLREGKSICQYYAGCLQTLDFGCCHFNCIVGWNLNISDLRWLARTAGSEVELPVLLSLHSSIAS